MVKAGRKSAFIRVSGLFVAYGNDKATFLLSKKQHGRHPSGAVCRVLYRFYVFM